MKKYLYFVIILGAVFLFKPLYAQDTSPDNFYIGVGASYALQDIDFSAFDNSWGLNGKVGCHLHPLLDIEFDYDYLNEFENEYREDISFEIMTYMVALKGYFPFSTTKTKLSVVVGAGLMDADAGQYDFEVDACLKGGLIFDFFATQNFSLGVEGNYTFGLYDLEDIRYFNFTAGVAYHF